MVVWRGSRIWLLPLERGPECEVAGRGSDRGGASGGLVGGLERLNGLCCFRSFLLVSPQWAVLLGFSCVLWAGRMAALLTIHRVEC